MRIAERILLSSIKTLAFFADEDTFARRTEAIPQLTCVGQGCKLYQPEAVLCTNIGGRGTEVNWKCEADLPETLRFGKVTVSCEGWSKSGDPYVLDGSCGLEYKLVRVPVAFQPTFDELPSLWRRMFDWIYSDDVPTLIFSILWLAILSYFLWSILRSCMSAHRQANIPHSRPSPNDGTRPGGGTGGSYPGSFSFPDNDSTPPPYTKNGTTSDNSTNAGGWTPGFWSGLGLGALAASLWNRNRGDAAAEALARQRQYDWERARLADGGGLGSGLFGGGGIFGSRWGAPSVRRRYSSRRTRDEGSSAGPSGLGQTRRSTGLGSSNVR